MRSGRLLVGLACGLAAVVITIALLAGGRGYRPQATNDPCSKPPTPNSADRAQLGQEIALDIVQRAACHLGVSRESLALALLSPASSTQFEQLNAVSPGTVEDAVRAAAKQALDDVSKTGPISGVQLTLLKEAVDTVPFDQVLDAVRGTSDPCKKVTWKPTASMRSAIDQIAVIGLARAACTLQSPAQDVALALASATELRAFQQRHNLSDAAFQDILRQSLSGAVDDAEQAAGLNPLAATALRATIAQAPIGTLLSMVQGQGLG